MGISSATDPKIRTFEIPYRSANDLMSCFRVSTILRRVISFTVPSRPDGALCILSRVPRSARRQPNRSTPIG